MKTAGWCANTTTPARKPRCTSTSASGGAAEAPACGPAAGAGSAASSRRNTSATPSALITTATAAFQPKVASMKAMSQPQTPATISTGGAAKGVSVPPMEMLTNSAPSVA